MRTTTLRLLTVQALLIQISRAQRTIVVENRCDYTVYPAISAFPGNEKERYAGEPGWEAHPGQKHSITMPSSWSGRIWGRRGCMTDTTGLLICVAGGCPNGLDCGESVLSESTALELRLKSSQNGQYDAYDLQNGGGWSVPTRVTPQAKSCTAVECVPDLDGCPKEEMKLKDSYGIVLGCASACFANVGDSNVQCCTGDFADPSVCTSDKIFGYEYFKTPCKNSYAYFQDRSSTTVDILCPAEGDPGYTLTFCPGSESGKGSSNATEETGSDKNTKPSPTQPDGQPTGTVNGKPTDIPALTSAIIVEGPDSANSTTTPLSKDSSGTSSSSLPSTSISSTNAAASTSSPQSDNLSESASALAGEIMGLKTPVFAGVVGGIVVVGILAVLGVVFCMRRGNSSSGQSRAVAASEEAVGPATRTEMTASNSNPAQSYALGRRRSQTSGRRALLAEQGTSSDLSSSEDEHPLPARRTSTRSARSARR